MWSSWSFGADDSKRCRVDSCVSTIHACFVFRNLHFLHGRAASSGTSNFLLAFSTFSLYSPSSTSIKFMLLNLRALSSFGFSIVHSCFSLFWAVFPILVHTSGHKFSGLVVAWFFVSLSSGTCPLGYFSFSKMNFVNPFQESDKLRFKFTFQ